MHTHLFPTLSYRMNLFVTKLTTQGKALFHRQVWLRINTKGKPLIGQIRLKNVDGLC